MLALATMAAGCQPPDTGEDRSAEARDFPRAHRPVSPLGANQVAPEAKRDEAGEAEWVMDRAGILPGMSVADIGAGNGYYTIRLAERVGPKGRVLAEDIDPGAIRTLGERITRENLDNVSIVTGTPEDPRLPPDSFDRILLVHMYHEVTEPYAFLWHMRPALKKNGEIIVVEKDRPTDQHGIPPELLNCEFEAVGLTVTEYVRQDELGGYFVRAVPAADRPDPQQIEPCAKE